MKIDAVGVTSKNIQKTVEFYLLLGFKFPKVKGNEDHVEAETPVGEVRLMIDSAELFRKLNEESQIIGNHSVFALLCDTPQKVNEITKKIKQAGFTLAKEPWDAFWGQRYAVVEDPDGYRIDLFAKL